MLTNIIGKMFLRIGAFFGSRVWYFFGQMERYHIRSTDADCSGMTMYCVFPVYDVLVHLDIDWYTVLAWAPFY